MNFMIIGGTSGISGISGIGLLARHYLAQGARMAVCGRDLTRLAGPAFAVISVRYR